MYYRPKNPKKYAETLTQFIDKENPPEHIFLYEIRDRETIMHILDMFPRSKFYIVDEPHFVRLLLKWPKKNYSKRILAYEMLKTTDPEDDKKDPSVEELISPLEAILKKVEVNDLIVIMNPPYGYRNKIVKPIIEKTLEFEQVGEIICLAPQNAYKPYLSYMQGFVKVNNLFDDVTVESLAISKFLSKEVNKFSFEELCLGEKELGFYKAVCNYNNVYKRNWYITYHNAVGCFKKWNLSLKEIFQNEIFFETNLDKSFEYFAIKNCVFYITQWTPFDGVHLAEDCWDFKLNEKHEAPSEKLLSTFNGKMFIFQDEKFKNNFSKWWYSCKENWNGNKKQKTGLTNFILKIMYKTVSGGAGPSSYNKYFPNLDWSRSWTDEEIIQELKDKAGLPKDWVLQQ